LTAIIPKTFFQNTSPKTGKAKKDLINNESAMKVSDTKIDVSEFRDKGFLILPGLLDADLIDSVKRKIVELEGHPELPPVLDETISSLLVHPQITKLLSEVMEGKKYVFHHLHASQQKAGVANLAWHHDYEQYPSGPRTHTMVHVFLYLNGLNGTIGDLLLVPGSHREIVDRYYYADKDFDYFSNIVTLNDLKPGSVVVINSALIHARRAKPGGESLPRFFVDMSFCQAGNTWPPYLEAGNWRAILNTLRNRHASLNEMQQSLFDESLFHQSLKSRVIEQLRLRKHVNMLRTAISRNRHKRLF
jgi:hypothetical protein